MTSPSGGSERRKVASPGGAAGTGLLRENDVLAEICRAIVQEPSPAGILQEGTERLQDYFGAASIGLWLLEDDDLVLHGICLTDPRDASVAMRIREGYGVVPLSGDGPGRRAIRERATVRVSAGDPSLNPDYRRLLRDVGAAALTAIPVFVDGDPAGCAMVATPEGETLSVADESLLSTAVSVLGLVFRRGRLEALEREHERKALQSYHMAAVGQLAAGVAHEVNNPLNAILHMAETLLLDGELNPEIRDDMELIRIEAQRAGNIVRNLGTFARRGVARRQPTDLTGPLGSTVELERKGMELEGMGLEVEVDPETPAALTDAKEFQQVLYHLLSNAREAVRELGAEGGWVRVRLEPRGENVALVVEDTGPGLTEDVRNAMFTPFFSTKSVGRGTGLGLSVSYGTVQEHGGRIEGDNWGRPPVEGGEPGEGGARFTVTLPAWDGPVPPEDPGGAMERDILRIIVVDDEEAVGHAVGRYLKKLGHHVETFTDARAALGRLEGEAGDVDAILTDLRMPGMDGIDFFRALEEGSPDLARRVVFATGDIVTPSTRTFLQSTGQPTFTKPYDVTELVETLARIAEAGEG